jgi:DNA-binding NarL/FixJ family response regulator
MAIDSGCAGITAVIVDDEGMVREGFRLQIERSGIHVVGEATNGRDAMFVIADRQPNVALIDINLPIRNGIEVAAEVHRLYPPVGLIMLADSVRRDLVVRSFKAGAAAYVWKGRPAEELGFAVKTVVEGLMFISPAVAGDLIAEYLSRASATPSELDRLSSRERELLQLVAEGATNKEIATTLDLSVRTAEKHRYRLMKRLGVHSAAELVLFAVRTGLVDPSKQQSYGIRSE